MPEKLDSYMQGNETRSPIIQCQIKINSNWIKNLIVRLEAIKILVEKIDGKPLDIGLGQRKP